MDLAWAVSPRVLGSNLCSMSCWLRDDRHTLALVSASVSPFVQGSFVGDSSACIEVYEVYCASVKLS